MRDDEEIEVHENFGWALLVIGLLFVSEGLDAIRSGKVTQSVRHRLGYVEVIDVESERNPILFLVHVSLRFVLGGVFLTLGASCLLTR